MVFGTAEENSDDLTAKHSVDAWFSFVLVPAWLPRGLAEFVEQVVPVLQRRGRFRASYEAATLRANLGTRGNRRDVVDGSPPGGSPHAGRRGTSRGSLVA